MLPTKTDFTQTGNIGGDEIKMGLDENSLAHLQMILTDLYSDKEFACVREYSTNALDSHKAAGQTKPIEITTPSPLAPFFKVKDYGVGLSVDDIRNIYSKYGASTARETNEKTGMLGLGCKSALTYTNQFTVVAVKDGTKINVAVSRTEDGGGTMTVLSETASAEPNGVEIVIPVNKRHDFERKTKEFFRFWNPEKVLINGEHPPKTELLKVTDEIYIHTLNPGYYNENYVVMGGVTYKVDFGKAPDLYYANNRLRNVVMFVDMGSVNFTPSREQLHYTHKTNATLSRLVTEYNDGIQAAIEKDIDGCATHAEALKKHLAWNQIVRGQTTGVKYKDVEIPQGFVFDFGYKYGAGEVLGSQGWGNKAKFSYGELKKANIVVGYEAEKLTTTAKNKMRLWQEAQEGSAGRLFVVCNEMPGSPWTDDLETVPWSEIKAMRKPRDQTVKTPTYDVWEDDEFSGKTELDPNKPIYYIGNREAKDRNISRKAYSEGAQVVTLSANRIDAFKRKYPTAKPLIEVLAKRVTDFFAGVTEEQLQYLNIDYSTRALCAIMDIARIEDPEVKSVIEIVDKSNTKFDAFAKEFKTYRDLACKVGVGHTEPSTKAYNVFDRYPLLGSVGTYRADQKVLDHMYDYVNNAFKKYYSKGVK